MTAPGIQIITPVSVEPLLLSDAKTHLRVTATADDTYITSLITAARVAAESFTGATLAPTGFRMQMDTWPGTHEPWWDGMRQGDMSVLTLGRRQIEVPQPPLIAVSAINAYDDADVAVLMPATDYYVDSSDPLRQGRIVLRLGKVWPVALRVANAIVVDYTAGFGSTFIIPGELKQALLMICAFLYKYRGDPSKAQQALVDCGAMLLLTHYRVLPPRIR